MSFDVQMSLDRAQAAFDALSKTSSVETALFLSSSLLVILTTVVAGAAAARSALRKGIEIEASGPTREAIPGQVPQLPSGPGAREEPFEATALAAYYNHALRRANVSFYFSLGFAAVGFGVIILAFATHDRTDTAGTFIKLLGGGVIDLVSGLFYVQSNNAQKSMGEFFEKLRLDRLNIEARAILAEIENGDKRDELRSLLVRKFSGIDVHR